MLKKLLGLAPQTDTNDGYIPSPLALKLTTSSTTGYDPVDYDKPDLADGQKILMVCTEEKYMRMKNGRLFSTGNHPVEMLVPMLHLQSAGFEIKVATPNGRPAKIEKWAMPKKDEAVNRIYEEFKPQFDDPLSLADIIEARKLKKEDHIALFFPGGHGAMLGLPEEENVKKLIHWFRDNDKYILAICHGPAALLATDKGEGAEDFPFKGYKIAAFPDLLDKITPWLGYLPGRMPWYFGERLKSLGVEIVNKNANGTCHQDRKLITGDSPDAANEFGKMATSALLEELKK